jgi:MraZ protein
LIGYASALDIDANGRVLVPPTLRDYANLDKKMMLVGQGKKLELWSEESWLALLSEPASDDIPAEMLSLSL